MCHSVIINVSLTWSIHGGLWSKVKGWTWRDYKKRSLSIYICSFIINTYIPTQNVKIIFIYTFSHAEKQTNWADFIVYFHKKQETHLWQCVHHLLW